MSRGNLLYDRPDLTQRFGKLALYVDGALSSAIVDASYDGRLQIHNAIGDCWAELINGELPPGSSITVDNVTHEVVVAWPAYSEAAVPVVNGDFEADDTSWLRDAGWTIEAKGARPDDTSGTNAAAFRGSGEAFIEAATFYPMTGVQQSINYGVKIQQGGSSSGNVRAAAALRYYDAEHKLIATDMGNVVSSGSDGEWKASGGTSLKPGAAAWVRPAVWGLRKRQSRPLYADDFTWNLNGVAVGVHNSADYPVAIRVHDAGGRVADWAGIIAVRSVTTLDPTTLFAQGTGGTLSADKLTLTKTADPNGWPVGARAPTSSLHASGKFYIEYTTLVAPTRAEDRGAYFGFFHGSNLSGSVSGSSDTFVIQSDTSGFVNGVTSITGPRFSSAGQTVGLAVDTSTGEVWWRNANGWNPGGDPASGVGPVGVISAAKLTGGLLPYAVTYATNGQCRVNFGQESFKLGPVPAGFFGGWPE